MASQPKFSLYNKPPANIILTEDWNARSEDRRRVLSALKEALKGSKVRRTFWAFCQVADISKLQSLVDNPLMALLSQDACQVTIQQWLGKPGAFHCSTSSQILASEGAQSDSAAAKCTERDNNCCVLTGYSGAQAAHIYQPVLSNAVRSDPLGTFQFWAILELFWDKERVTRWKAEVFGKPGTLRDPKHDCFHLLGLSPDMHDLWKRAYFALRPLEPSADKKKLQIQLFWQTRAPGGSMSEMMDLLDEPLKAAWYFSQRTDKDPDTQCRVHIIRKRDSKGGPVVNYINSSNIYSLTTTDPDKLPLPSYDLLEMQWYLHRVAAMSGVVDMVDDLKKNDSSGE